MSDISYIDWSKAPEGTTHAFTGIPEDWERGVPKYRVYWEKVDGGFVYEWNSSTQGWDFVGDLGLADYTRTAKEESQQQPSKVYWEEDTLVVVLDGSIDRANVKIELRYED